ncbi:hypothetical protein K435DRAFT_846105 [Dendrothele bispora CBS 962.96]|uniref:Uncharacterized protein n=1 Tax=Dendrothele bispora (strain CBS 962.96) TaxID=1314807 RepID=A0A4S8KPV6_DENBC|nr:hypothetical protein K435DRAFT_846105 [Dendrothele bispora CBS 962.96]
MEVLGQVQEENLVKLLFQRSLQMGVHVSGHNAHLPPHPIFTATRLASTTQSESNNNPGISVEINAPNLHSGSNAGNLFSDTNDSVPNSGINSFHNLNGKGSWLSNSKPKKLILKLMVMEFESKGIAWKTALRAKPDAIQKRIRYVCLPPERLAADLYKFFECWQDVICSKDPKLKLKLFNETAWKQAAGIVEAARRGLLSDPPGIPLYYVLGVDRDNLTIYRCIRGTNSVEGGIHMTIRRTFGALRASPEFADALLALIRHRRNQRVGFANRTGGTYRNHFENWTLDEIMELAAEVNVVTSFPQPNLLATRIETSEVFGIIPIPEQTTKQYDIRTATRPVIQPIIYYRDTPAHLRIHLSTAPLNAYVYLQQQQRTAHPVVPVHTHAEYKLFNELIKTEKFIRVSSKSNSKNINFEKMALEWNHHVDSRYSQSVIPGHASALYYKLPEQLEQHHKVWAALLAENATLYNSEISRKEATAILTDSARYASTLPPTQLSTQKSRKRKEKAIEPQTDDLTTTLPFNDIEMADVFGTSPTNEDFMVEDSMETQDPQDASGSANVAIKTKTTSSLHSESVGSGSGSIKKAKKKAKRCGLCRDATCSQAEACPGSRFCTCNHTFPEGKRRRIRH